MCAPDLKGSQGTFAFYTTDKAKIDRKEGGVAVPVEIRGDRIETFISGPENSLLKEPREVRLPLTIDLDRAKKEASITVSGRRWTLKEKTFSPWVRLDFRPGLGLKVKAIARFYISSIEPHFEMYQTPLNIDPEKPALPISHPFIYSVYLSKLLGRFITLGEANDTWALNEGALSEAAFLELTYSNHREWEAMLFNALAKTRKGAVVCVFETTDSIQHMFWRYLDDSHPALVRGPRALDRKVIDDLYMRMDDLVGRVRDRLGPKAGLMVMSDHGFKSFRRGVNLNSWLRLNGYLQLKDGKSEGAEWFRDVDWTRTRAYGLGLGGIYVNQKGREAQGIVAPGEETRALKAELIGRLSGLRDGARQETADHRGPRPGPDLRRTVQRQRPRSDRRLQPRLQGLLGFGDRKSERHRLRGQHQGLERRPLHRPPSRARRFLLQRQDRLPGAVHHRHCSHRADTFRPAGARAHGRPGARGRGSGTQDAIEKEGRREDKMSAMTRRDFIRQAAAAAALVSAGAASPPLLRTSGRTATRSKVIILGFDGMDHRLIQRWLAEGKLPAFARLVSQGGLRPLRSSLPPQSPVAWSNFITGTDPGGHGIFDFMHRDPKTYWPVFSGTLSTDARTSIKIGDLVLPVRGGEVRNLMRGRAFWQILEDHDIPATIFKIPSNYPPLPTRQRTISGMGTPDLKGSYGILNFYTTKPTEINEDIGGARIHQVYVIGDSVQARLPGPVNTFKKDRPDAEVEFRVFIDPVHPVAKIRIQDQEFILREKEWSGWKTVRFDLLPTQSADGICMFYLKELRPDFKLYVSPINIDPSNPVLPISTPASYAQELADKFGPFFTKGLPADTSALDNGILDEEEFLEQDDMVLRESEQMFDYEFSRFDSGLPFLLCLEHRPAAAHVLALPRREPSPVRCPAGRPVRRRD